MNNNIIPTFTCLIGLSAWPAGAANMVCIEAEHPVEITRPMQIVDATAQPETLKNASGGKYLEVPDGAGKPPEVGGSAVYSFTIDSPGTYYLWGRVWWPDGCGNSFSMSLNDAKEFAFGQDGTEKRWHWVAAPPRLKQLELDKGTHKLVISNREDGAKIDQILLVKNRRYVPVDIEKATVEPPAKCLVQEATPKTTAEPKDATCDPTPET